jgi:hypothetical protein
MPLPVTLGVLGCTGGAASGHTRATLASSAGLGIGGIGRTSMRAKLAPPGTHMRDPSPDPLVRQPGTEMSRPILSTQPFVDQHGW